MFAMDRGIIDTSFPQKRVLMLKIASNGVELSPMTRRVDMATYTADKVADTLIHLARERHIDITNLKLQKLLYYAQAWNLVFKDEELFAEDIEAWIHGPVVPSVFRRFKSFRWNTIDSPVNAVTDDALGSHLVSVLDAYGKFGANQLERLTHEEEPWRIARSGVAPDAPSNAVISKKSMKTFYTDIFNGAKK
jgi:uncharacterized phage-associated protein